MKKDKIKIIVAEDSKISRLVTVYAIRKNPKFEIVAIVENGVQVLEFLSRSHADILVLDLEMPVMNGRQTLQQVTMHYKDTRVIIFTGHDDPVIINECIAMGASSFLSKGSSEEELIETLLQVSVNKYFLSAHNLEIISAAQSARTMNSFLSSSITKKELQVLRELALGQSEEVIASKLGNKTSTIRTHKKSLMQKTGTHNTTNLLAHARKAGII